jgi:hypothetical protein
VRERERGEVELDGKSGIEVIVEGKARGMAGKRFRACVPTTTLTGRMTTRAGQEKNIWIAAGDGDLERVQVSSPF